MSIKLMAAAWEIELPTPEKMVLLILCDHANDDGVCWPSVATMGRKSGLSERTIQRALKSLSDDGLFAFKDTPGKGRKYTLNSGQICRKIPAEISANPRHSDTPPPSE